MRYGTEEQKQAFLPGISRGEIVFGIGMSEPDSGSDLASVRTRAERVDGGWRLTGTKVWTSGAHEADGFFALARSAPLDPKRRHDGLSQFIIDLHAPEIEIRPIVSMGGDHHFNEVHLGGVVIPDDRVLGQIGDGWAQVTSELGFERSGPERFLSTFQLLAAAASAMNEGSLPLDTGLGRHVARVAALHHMSFAISSALEDQAEPVSGGPGAGGPGAGGAGVYRFGRRRRHRGGRRQGARHHRGGRHRRLRRHPDGLGLAARRGAVHPARRRHPPTPGVHPPRPVPTRSCAA